jgi:hypothetical protein
VRFTKIGAAWTVLDFKGVHFVTLERYFIRFVFIWLKF